MKLALVAFFVVCISHSFAEEFCLKHIAPVDFSICKSRRGFCIDFEDSLQTIAIGEPHPSAPQDRNVTVTTRGCNLAIIKVDSSQGGPVIQDSVSQDLFHLSILNQACYIRLGPVTEDEPDSKENKSKENKSKKNKSKENKSKEGDDKKSKEKENSKEKEDKSGEDLSQQPGAVTTIYVPELKCSYAENSVFKIDGRIIVIRIDNRIVYIFRTVRLTVVATGEVYIISGRSERGAGLDCSSITFSKKDDDDDDSHEDSKEDSKENSNEDNTKENSKENSKETTTVTVPVVITTTTPEPTLPAFIVTPTPASINT